MRSTRPEAPLHEYQVEPAAEFITDLVEVRGPLETEPRMQCDGCVIVGIDARNEANKDVSDPAALSHRAAGRPAALDES